jgi:hypothetical protein
MEISKTTIGVLATLCISAGAGAAYLTTRSDAPVPADASPDVVAETPTFTPSASEAAVTEPVPDLEQLPAPGDAVRPISRPALTSDTSSPQEPPVATRRAVPPPAAAAVPDPVAAHETRPEAAFAGASAASATPTPELDALPLPEVPLGAQSLLPPSLTPVRPTAPELVRALEPPDQEFEEFVVSTDSVVGLQVETFTTSESARVEDKVVARVTRDVRVRDRVVIPAGSVVRGEVMLVERGGQLRDRARLGVRFTLVELADATRIPIETDIIYREGDARGAQSASRIGGGAIAGAIIGGIFGGKKGAAIGGSVGAGAGTAAALSGSRDPAVLQRGAAVTVRITAPTTVILPRE